MHGLQHERRALRRKGDAPGEAKKKPLHDHAKENKQQ